MLPKIDGITLARHISSQSLTPIIMLTARDDEATMLEGYAAGADHFLSKPFKVPELLVRIQAILRRVGKQQTHLNLETHKENGVSSLQMLKEKVSGLPLTETELSLVTYLINHHDIVVDKSRLQMDVLKKSSAPLIVTLICMSATSGANSIMPACPSNTLRLYGVKVTALSLI